MKHERSRRRLALPFALLLLPAILAGGQAPRAETAPGLEDVVRDVEALRLAGSGVPIGERTLSIGHLELRLSNGTAFPLETPSGEIYGLYYEGEGSYRYSSEDAVDRLTIPRNLERCAPDLKLDGNSIEDPVRRLVLFHARPAFPELWSGETARTVPAGGDVRSGFERMWADARATDLAAEHLAATARLNAGDLQYVYAEIEGARARVGYEFDRLRYGWEYLLAFRKYSTYDLRIRDRLSSQRVKRPRSGSDGKIATAFFDIATDDNRRGSVVTDLDLEVPGGVRVVHLDLVNNFDPDRFDWKSSKNKLTLRRVADGDGRELPESHRYHEVLLEVPETPPEGKVVRLHFETEGEIFLDMQQLHADNYFLFLGNNWYPSPIHRNGVRFDYSIRARTRKPWVPVSSGKQVALREEGESFVLESKSEAPAWVIAIAGGQFKTVEKTYDGLTIRVHAYAMARKNVMESMPQIARDMIRFYEGIAGKYPFEELDIVEVPEYGFGIAPAGLVLLTSEAYNPRQDWLASYLSRGINARLAHEIAHQWFGNRATPAEREDDWLSESLAEYFSGLAMDAAKQDERVVAGFEKMHAEWWVEAKRCRDTAPIAAASLLGFDEFGRDRFCLLYNRGPLVLHMMHTMIGRERFQGAVRAFFDGADGGIASTDDFAEAASKVLKTDFHWFVDQWIRRSGIPEIAVTYRFERGPDGQPALVGEARQTDSSGFKKLIIPVAIELQNGRTETRVLVFDEPVKKFSLPVSGPPKKVRIDPAQVNLALFR